MAVRLAVFVLWVAVPCTVGVTIGGLPGATVAVAIVLALAWCAVRLAKAYGAAWRPE